MRIIAGQRRGHKFDGPRDQSTRPTSDLVREAIFNILGEAVEGLLVIDLFAGTGAIGLEALSRGATRSIFVERNRGNLDLIRRNIATLRYEDRASVISHDAYRWAKSYTFEEDEPVVVFIDPPYADYDNHPDRIRKLLEGLISSVPVGSIIAAESRLKLDDDVLPELETWDVRRYGGNASRHPGCWLLPGVQRRRRGCSPYRGPHRWPRLTPGAPSPPRSSLAFKMRGSRHSGPGGAFVI